MYLINPTYLFFLHVTGVGSAILFRKHSSTYENKILKPHKSLNFNIHLQIIQFCQAFCVWSKSLHSHHLPKNDIDLIYKTSDIRVLNSVNVILCF